MPAPGSTAHHRSMKSQLFAAALVPLLACTPFTSSAASEPSVSTSIATGDLSTADRLTEATTGARPAVGRSTDVVYEDVLGEARTIQVELRLPEQRATEPDSETSGAARPVVVWSHGGGTGKRSTASVGERWGRAFNAAGFAFVAIAHAPRSAADRVEMCEAIRVADCSVFSPLRWDRPHDLAAALDWVESIADDQRLDADRIVLGGHSAGAIGVLNTMGLTWTFDSELEPAVDDRPIAVLAASPPGAEARDISPADLAELDVPMLWLTGAGDTTASTRSEDRRATFELLSADHDAALFWATPEAIRHGGFNLDVDSCRRAGGSDEQCRNAARTIARTGVSFVEQVTAAGGFDIERYVVAVAAKLPGWAMVTVAG